MATETLVQTPLPFASLSWGVGVQEERAVLTTAFLLVLSWWLASALHSYKMLFSVVLTGS